MSEIAHTWTMQQFRRDFEAVFWAAPKAPQMITVRGAPAYVLVLEPKTKAKKLKADIAVTLHKLQKAR